VQGGLGEDLGEGGTVEVVAEDAVFGHVELAGAEDLREDALGVGGVDFVRCLALLVGLVEELAVFGVG